MLRTLRGPRGWLTLALLAAGAAQAQAQNAVITGRVASEQGQPLQGANVLINELNISVGTNQTGNYTITVPAARVSGQTVMLRVRSVGFVPQNREITVTAGNQTVDFTLRPDVTRLSEVVVTGVSQATEQIKVPFAVARVDTSQMPVTGTSAVQQLQGKIAGANITQASGRPGAAPAVVLRGPTSINASGRAQGPLYIVDGVLLNGATPDLNPNDIENIEVVKGAAAASLYGARAGGGVINITTKSGKNASEGVKFGVRTEFGMSDIPHKFNIAKQTAMAFDPTGQDFCGTVSAGGSPCARFIDIEAEAKRVNNVSTSYSLPPQNFMNDGGIASNLGRYRLLNLYQTNSFAQTYDQVEQATKTDLFNNTNLDVRGRMGNTGFYASAGLSRQAGGFEFLEGYRRVTGRVNLDQKLGDKFTMQVNSFFSTQHEDGGNQEGGTGFFRLSRSPAFVNQFARDDQGRLYIRSNPTNQGSQNANPLYYLESYNQAIHGTRFLGSMNGRYTATDWLEFSGDFAYDRGTSNTTWLQDRGFRTTEEDPATAVGFIQNNAGDSRSLNASLGASLRPRLLENLNSTFSARVLYDRARDYSQFGYGEDIAVPGLYTGDAALKNFSIGSGTSEDKAMSYFGGLDLDYYDRYILNLSMRREGSSRFGSDERWATFPRVAGAWIASQEPWWPAADALTLVKFRAAWGKAGQRPRRDAQYETYGITSTGALSPQTLGNKELKPEILTEVEVGTDMELFGRYALNLTYAQSKAEDQILLVPAPAASGFPEQWQNAGTLQNKTWEASLDIPLINNADMRWSTRLIYDRNRAVITELRVPPYNSSGGPQGAESMYFVREGERLGTIYGRTYVTSCAQLPGDFASRCGGIDKEFQANDQGYIVWTGPQVVAGESNLTNGIKYNLWNASLNEADAPWAVTDPETGNVKGTRAVFGMPINLRDADGNIENVALGNATPDFHAGLSTNFSWRKLTAYALFDGSFGREIWNEGYHWALGDFMTGTTDQAGRSVENAKPLGYYYRAGPSTLSGGSSGVGGLYNALGPTIESVEDASYVKLREVTLTYNFGAIAGQGNWTLGLVGRNLLTFTDYRGYDPEVGRGGGQLNSAALNGIDYFTFPNLRTFTVQLSTAF
jgi:TonB-linked SusC/RagA family outer membrane protein